MPVYCRAQSSDARDADEYDMDYDRGRVKKVRRKDTGADAPADGNRFQAAWSQRGEPGSSLGPVARTSSSSGAYQITVEQRAILYAPIASLLRIIGRLVTTFSVTVMRVTLFE